MGVSVYSHRFRNHFEGIVVALVAALLTGLAAPDAVAQRTTEPRRTEVQQLAALREALASPAQRQQLCRMLQIADARSFVPRAFFERLGASASSTGQWRAALAAAADALCEEPFDERRALRSLDALGKALTSMGSGLTERALVPKNSSAHVLSIAAAHSTQLYERVCRRMPGSLLMRVSEQEFATEMGGERVCPEFLVGGGAAVQPGDIPETSGQPDLPTDTNAWRGDVQACFKAIAPLARPEPACNSLADNAAQLNAADAQRKLEEAVKAALAAHEKKLKADEALKAAQKANTDNPTDANKKAVDKAQADKDKADADYDKSIDDLADAKWTKDVADAALQDAARDDAAAFGGLGAAVTGALAVVACGATGPGCALGAFLMGVSAGMAGGAAIIVSSRWWGCLMPVQPAPGLSISYLVANGEGPRHGSRVPQPGAFELTRNPPNWHSLYNYCTCAARLGSLSQYACSSPDERNRMECLSRPFDEHGAPRPECLDLLKEDNAQVPVRHLACSLMQCADGFLAPTSDGGCACVPRNEVAGAMAGHPANQSCRAIMCAEGSECFCASSGCSCRPRTQEIPLPWIAPQPPPGPTPGPGRGGATPSPPRPELPRSPG